MTADQTDTVLIVDDERMVVRSLESFLTLETPYRVLTFCSPLEALGALESESVQVVVADFMMPEMDGITFLKKSREVQPEATRLLLTGYADKENAIRAINEVGLYYYLEKPWDNEHLKLVIRNGIERSTLFNELSSRVEALEKANEELQGFRERLVKAFL
ncbi:MAG TPA: response regulator [Longimicrobiales bacterium]|nr:response regulator [Longimicrobiales bacterium]